MKIQTTRVCTLMITHICNLNCIYCFEKFKSNNPHDKMSIDTAKKIVSNIGQGKLLSQDKLDDIKVSFIEEVCNIVGSTYIRNIADYLNIKIEIENSSLLYDELTAILSYTLMEEEQFYSEVINIQTDFKYEFNSEFMNVYFYFVPRKGNIDKIFN